MLLESFLDAKPLYYDEIDYSRMPRIYAKVKEQIPLAKIIHLVGTNGKGTTGRFLATALHRANYSVGHYTSPHIMKFNERIWRNGAVVDDRSLQEAHESLLNILSREDADALSYFEYATLLALSLYSSCEYVVLEAGLGGEGDATAVFENILTLVTPIDRDHEAFLGDTIEKIAVTKLNAVQKSAILAKQSNQEVYQVAEAIAQKRGWTLKSFEELLGVEDRENIEHISRELGLSGYLSENLSLAIAALHTLGVSYSVESFYGARLFGRLTQLSENIILDVGHNALAASRLLESLAGSKYTLIYNSYKDKDYREILHILKPIIAYVAIIDVVDSRIEKRENLQSALEDLEIEFCDFNGIVASESYLLFGSFSVAEQFLKEWHG